MCGHCYDDWGCYGPHYYQGQYYQGPPRFYEEPKPETRREYLEDEKRTLERRLKDIEARIAEASK
jgi:hypothetical protein